MSRRTASHLAAGLTAGEGRARYPKRPQFTLQSVNVPFTGTFHEGACSQVGTPVFSLLKKRADADALHMVTPIGLVTGFIARALHPGKDNLRLIMMAVLGIAGSFAATFLGQAVGSSRQGETAGFILSVIAAVILLAIYGFLAKNKDGRGSSGTPT